MGFLRQEYWGGFPFPSPGDLPHPRIESRSPELLADSLPSEPTRNSKTYVLSKTVYSNINIITLFVSRPKKKLIFHVTGIISTIAGKFS